MPLRVGSIRRKLSLSVRWARSAICPVISSAGGAGGDDQAVVGDGHGAVGGHRGGGLGLEVDVGHLTQEHPSVALGPKDVSGCRGDLAGGQDARGHLVEQRLEQVVGGLGDERDLDRRLAERLGGEQASEAEADQDHSMRRRLRLLHVLIPLVRDRAIGHAIEDARWERLQRFQGPPERPSAAGGAS